MTGHKSRIQRLGVYEEVVGNLRSMTSDEGFVVAQVGKVGIVLPPEVECKLAPLVGMRIGILRTDIPGKEYLIRIMAEEKSPAFNGIEDVGMTKIKAHRAKASA